MTTEPTQNHDDQGFNRDDAEFGKKDQTGQFTSDQNRQDDQAKGQSTGQDQWQSGTDQTLGQGSQAGGQSSTGGAFDSQTLSGDRQSSNQETGQSSDQQSDQQSGGFVASKSDDSSDYVQDDSGTERPPLDGE